MQIVTGAQNLHEGDLVPAAKDNSWLPGGVHITRGNLRGEKSKGMMCSYKELGMTDHDWPFSVVDGILLLESDPDLKAMGLKPGDDIRAPLGLDDHVVEFEITPNRPDCLCRASVWPGRRQPPRRMTLTLAASGQGRRPGQPP